MSASHLLKTLAAGKPLFDFPYAILSAPVRHTFIIATVWYLAKTKQQPLDILEIGSWYGASTLSWAQGLRQFKQGQGQITCVDAWQPFFDQNSHNNEVYQIMEAALNSDQAYQIYLHNVSTLPNSIVCQHLRGKSNYILPLLRANHFDVVYIDGNHSYSAVKKDIENSLELVNEDCGSLARKK